MTHIVLVDDHPLLRRGILEVLRSRWHDARIDEADSAAGLFAALRAGAPDLVILDLSLPDRHGLECLEECRRRHPTMAVLVLSMHDEDAFGLRALDLGAMGYLTKERAPTELLSAVDRILRGRRYVGPELGEVLAERRGEVAQDPHELLSQREFGVLLMLADGRGPGEIASRLCLSPKTITTYRARVLGKLGLRNNAELVRYCVDRGLLS